MSTSTARSGFAGSQTQPVIHSQSVSSWKPSYGATGSFMARTAGRLHRAHAEAERKPWIDGIQLGRVELVRRQSVEERRARHEVAERRHLDAVQIEEFREERAQRSLGEPPVIAAVY